MPIEAMLFPAAALLYTVAILSQYLLGNLRAWARYTFNVAWLIDLTATVYVCVIRTGASPWPETIHGVAGYMALMIMLLHAAWAHYASVRDGVAMDYFHTGSVVAWILWWGSFTTGFPSLSPQSILAWWLVGSGVFIALVAALSTWRFEQSRKLRPRGLDA